MTGETNQLHYLLSEFLKLYEHEKEIKRMLKKTVILTVLALLAGLILSACAAPTQQAAGPVTFGLVLVGPKNDHGWSQAHFEAGQYVEAKLPGSKMIVFESLNPADKPEATEKPADPSAK